MSPEFVNFMKDLGAIVTTALMVSGILAMGWRSARAKLVEMNKKAVREVIAEEFRPELVTLISEHVDERIEPLQTQVDRVEEIATTSKKELRAVSGQVEQIARHLNLP